MYVIASRDCARNRLYYETGTETFHGNIYMGDILETKRFKTLEEVCNYIKNDRSEFMFGCSIIFVSECTFEEIAKNAELYNKYHDPNYAIR